MNQPVSLKDAYEHHLIACIDQQCAQTKKHIDRHRAHFANNRHVSGFSNGWKQLTFALCAAKAEGAYVYDMDGHAYLDITMGFGVHLFGHSPSFIKKAIHDQLEKNASLGPVDAGAGEVAQVICAMTQNERCAFFNSGTEAVMVALRLARAGTGKNKVVIFEGAYHGTLDALLVMKQHPATQEAIANVPGISQSLVQDTLLLSFGKKESLDFIEEHAGEIGAVLTEPVRSRFPEEINPDFLHRLQEVCAAHGIAFILDEVITGFRVANGGAKQVFALDPDIIVYGKVLGGGLPLGVVAGRKKYLDYIDGGQWSFYDDMQPDSPMTFVAGTFCHHPLTMAAVKATLEQLSRNGDALQNELTRKTAQFCDRLNGFCEDHAIPVRLACFSSLFRFLVKGKNRVLYHALLKEKVYVWEGRNCFLSLAHGDREIALLESRIKKCLAEMKAAGYFPVATPLLHSPGDEMYIQGGISAGELLKKEWVELAFSYTCENVALSNHQSLSKEIVFADNIPAFEAVQHAPGASSLQLTVLYRDGNTHLLLKAAKHCFDGWSLTLLLRHLGKCYRALETHTPLPANCFEDNEAIRRRLGDRAGNTEKATVYPAATIQKFLPAAACETMSKGSLFDHLLAAFAIALGQGEHIIGVPVSGQLVSRLLHTIGNHTCQVPVGLNVSPHTTPGELTDRIADQLKEARQSFRYWYTGNLPPPAIVFNMDNLQQDFSFGGKKVNLLPVADPLTLHSLVCNIISLPEGLHLSLKYRAGESQEKMEKLMEIFCSTITETAHVFEGG